MIYGNPEITSGGNALKFYASVRLEVRRKATIKGASGDDDVGIRVKAKVRQLVAGALRAEHRVSLGSGSWVGCGPPSVCLS